MATHITRPELMEALDLLDLVDAAGAPRELASIGMRLDGWLAIDEPIELPSGATFDSPGHRLGQAAAGTVWLLPHGHVLVVPRGAQGRPQPVPIVDVDLGATQLTDRLRAALLQAYLGGTDLANVPPALVFRTVDDLLGMCRELNPAGRELVARELASAMRPGEGWDAAAVRLRTGFEGLLGDRSPPVAEVAARALVHMAVGLGPRPPAGDPARGLVVMLRAPRTHVRAAALRALADLPDGVPPSVAETLHPRLRELLVDDDPEVRRLASALERQMGGGGRVADEARALESSDRSVRLDALARWAEKGFEEPEVLLPIVLDAADDPDPEIARSALVALAATVAREDAEIGHLVVEGLLRGRTATAVEAGCELLLRHEGLADERHVPALRGVLARGDVPTTRAAEALTATARAASVDVSVSVYDELIWHADPEVRRLALARVGTDVRDRTQVREALLPAILEHLSDPDPSVRLQTARTASDLGLPNATGIAGQLALDRDKAVRHGALRLLEAMGSGPTLEVSRRRVELADTLFDLASGGSPDERVHWAGALDRLAATESDRVDDLLQGLLRLLPATSEDPFVAFALSEIDERLLQRAGCSAALVETCRHLMAPPDPQPEHAARLAGACAAEEPAAFDLLWTMYTIAEGPAQAAARDALAGIVETPKSRAVAAAIEDLLRREASTTDRSLLRMLLRG